jgi:hypothetical protein
MTLLQIRERDVFKISTFLEYDFLVETLKIHEVKIWQKKY